MARQLIYTSAPSGIRPGSRGFTTVAMSRDLPPTWVSRLERMSGYNQLFGLSDQRSSLNPVNYSFMRLKVGNDAGLVISRISAAGADYSGRSNSIAHHLVLDRGELPAAGPAWLMQQPGLLAERFDGEPRLIEEPAAIPQGDVPPGPCQLWQKVAGDAGWAGGLLQVAMRGSGSACVIYKPGTDVLGLFAEAMALLPPAQRWQTSFSTYEHGSHSPEGFRWRGLPAGTAAAKEAKNLSDAVVIDLTKPLGAAADNAYSVAAREGRLLEAPKATPTRSAAGAPPARPGKGRRRVAAGAAAGEEGEYELALAGPRPPSLEYEEGPNLLGPPPRKSRTPWYRSLTAAILVFTLGTGAVVGVMLWGEMGGQPANGTGIATNGAGTDTEPAEGGGENTDEPSGAGAEGGETAVENGQDDQGGGDEPEIPEEAGAEPDNEPEPLNDPQNDENAATPPPADQPDTQPTQPNGQGNGDQPETEGASVAGGIAFELSHFPPPLASGLPSNAQTAVYYAHPVTDRTVRHPDSWRAFLSQPTVNSQPVTLLIRRVDSSMLTVELDDARIDLGIADTTDIGGSISIFRSIGLLNVYPDRAHIDIIDNTPVIPKDINLYAIRVEVALAADRSEPTSSRIVLYFPTDTLPRSQQNSKLSSIGIDADSKTTFRLASQLAEGHWLSLQGKRVQLSNGEGEINLSVADGDSVVRAIQSIISFEQANGDDLRSRIKAYEDANIPPETKDQERTIRVDAAKKAGNGKDKFDHLQTQWNDARDNWKYIIEQVDQLRGRIRDARLVEHDRWNVPVREHRFETPDFQQTLRLIGYPLDERAFVELSRDAATMFPR